MELFDRELNTRFAGKILDEAVSMLVGLTIGATYSADLIETEEVLPSGETHTRYRFTGISLASDGAAPADEALVTPLELPGESFDKTP